MFFLNRLIILILIPFSSCSSQDYNDFIEKYDKYNFNDFKGVNVTLRSSDISENIYVVTDTQGKYPAYFVHLNKTNNNIFIDNRMLKKSNIKDYVNNEKMIVLIKKIKELNFYILGVDQNENVYINPFKPNAPVLFLRLKKPTKEKSVKNGFIYNHYKNNWYINEI